MVYGVGAAYFVQVTSLMLRCCVDYLFVGTVFFCLHTVVPRG